METNQILPVLDTEVLREKANEFAMKGATESIKEYYSGYNSPFRKAIDLELEKKGVSIHLELPDIIGLLNTTISAEIDAIVNTSIAQTFIPQAKRLLTRADKELGFSSILKEFIEATDSENYDECEVEIIEEDRWGWLNIEVKSEKANYKFTLHLNDKSKDLPKKTYQLMSLPRNDNPSSSKMTMYLDDAKIEIPFMHDILRDRFISFMASLIIAKTIITIDTEYFDEDIFPERCHC